MAATIALAMIGPMPGTVTNCRQPSVPCASSSISSGVFRIVPCRYSLLWCSDGAFGGGPMVLNRAFCSSLSKA